MAGPVALGRTIPSGRRRLPLCSSMGGLPGMSCCIDRHCQEVLNEIARIVDGLQTDAQAAPTSGVAREFLDPVGAHGDGAGSRRVAPLVEGPVRNPPPSVLTTPSQQHAPDGNPCRSTMQSDRRRPRRTSSPHGGTRATAQHAAAFVGRSTRLETRPPGVSTRPRPFDSCEGRATSSSDCHRETRLAELAPHDASDAPGTSTGGDRTLRLTGIRIRPIHCGCRRS